jgi:hypothetical protein
VIRKATLTLIALTFALGIFKLAAVGQTPEAKEKPAMYTYVADWQLPRAQWTEMEKSRSATQPILDKALANGTLVGYGSDLTIVHSPDGATHDEWWSATSMAGILNVLDAVYKTGTPTSAVLSSATKHWDNIYVSRYYNWKPGTYKDAYTHGASYKLKADAPDDAVATLTKNLVAPLLDKMLAEGAIVEYDVDTQAVHTETPATFFIFYITPNAEGLDKVTAALTEALKASPLSGPAFGSMTDGSAHRDELARTTATYK